MPEPGVGTQGWVHIQYLFYPGPTGINDLLHGFKYHDPSPDRYEPRRNYMGKPEIEELTRASDGTWTVRMSFDGIALHSTRGEMPMKAVIHVEGMPEVESNCTASSCGPTP